MKRVLIALAAASWLAACGQNNTTPTPTGPQAYDQTQKPVSPKGSIIGRVVDVTTQTPLDGVTVKVLGADNSLTTNAEGTFRLDNVVVNSSYTFIFEKMGFLRMRATAQISGTTGNSPLEGSITTFSMEMFPSNGSVTGFVFLPNGRPAANATVYVDQRASLNAESVVTAQTDMNGAFTLSGLGTAPQGVTHSVFAQWYDENGDMQADYSTTNTNVRVFAGQPARTFLTYNSVGQRIVASNIVDGEVPAGEDLQFTFALPLFTGVLSGSGARPWVLTHTSGVGAVDVPVEGTFMSPTVLRVRPSLNSLREGEIYSLSLNLRNASVSNGTGADFSTTLSFQVRAATVTPFTTQVSGVTVTNPNPIQPFPETAFDFNQNSFTVSWLPAAGAVRYEVYARDTTNNPNYQRVQTNIFADGRPRYEVTFSLPGSFTTNFASGPLAGNNRVNFAVVGIDAYGSRAPLMAAMAVEVRDTIPPRVTSGPTLIGGGLADAINDTAAAQEIRLRITYSEPMDPMSMITYTSNATNMPTAAFRWDSSAGNASSGVLTLTVGAGNDATGSFVIRGGRDIAGNNLQQAGDLVGSLGGRRELLQTPDFQSGGMCALGSWTTTTLNGGPTPTVINNNGSITGNTSPCAAVLGSIPGGTPGVGRSRIIQSVTLPALSMTTSFALSASARYRSVNVSNPAQLGAAYTMRCYIGDAMDALLIPVFSTSGNSSTFQSSGNVNVASQAGNAVRYICEVENTNLMAPGFGALYLDEMSIALVKPGTI